MEKVTLEGTLNPNFKVVKDERSAFGFYLEYKGKLYEPDLVLVEVDFNENHTTSLLQIPPYFEEEDENGNHVGWPFDNVQLVE